MAEKKTGVITGATSGIGAAFAKAFAARNYDLILTGRRESKLNELAQDIQNQFQVSVEKQLIELAESEQVEQFISILQRQQIDLLINNAGFGMRSTFLETNYETLEQMVTVHSTVPMQLMHALLPGMKERRSGIIINVASIAGFFPLPQSGVYSATKSFLTLLSESLHVELEGTGVQVQALCPGMTITDFHSRLGKDPERFYKKEVR
ncbi:MAG: SDR family NAD(P)-dependent oxidoreductase [candidate division KSB1 bacterium]|nr:SDR family NAD(P)-dependent oxidoreductase [candidate division KSB1 bacterium]